MALLQFMQAGKNQVAVTFYSARDHFDFKAEVGAVMNLAKGKIDKE